MLSNDVLSFVKKKVLQAPESSPRPRPRPNPSRQRKSALNSASVRQRYGMSESTVEAYKSASAERRSSSVYMDAKSLEKIRQTISTGFQTATETVNKLTVPGSSASPAGTPSVSRSQPPRRYGSGTNVANMTLYVDDDDDDEDEDDNDEEDVPDDIDEVLRQLSLEAKQSSLEKDNNEIPVVEAVPEKPIDPRCKVCFKMISDTEFFRICTVCVRKVCDDCSASYNSKDEAEHEWRCSICIRGSATRDVQPSQSFLKATAAAQKRNQVKDLNHPQPQPVQVQQQQSQLSNEDSKPSPGIGAVINRVGKRQESFDANGGPPKPSRASSSGLMVPEQSGIRRHSTGNAAISAAALQSLRDAAAKAENVKQNLGERRRPSQSRLNVQALLENTQQPKPHEVNPKPGFTPNTVGMGQRPVLQQQQQPRPPFPPQPYQQQQQQYQQPQQPFQQPQQYQQPQQQQLYQQPQQQQQQQQQYPQQQQYQQQHYQQQPQKQPYQQQPFNPDMKKPAPTRNSSSGNLNRMTNLQQPQMNRRASSVLSVSQSQLYNTTGTEESTRPRDTNLSGSGELLGPRSNEERRASFESSVNDPLAVSRFGTQLGRGQQQSSDTRNSGIPSNTGTSDNRGWKGNQQLSGEGIQIVVDHVDSGDDQRAKQGNKRHGDSSRHGSFSGPSNTRQLTLYRNDDQDPYGFGLRVVGQQLQGEQPNQAQLQLCARVLWISPAGPAQRAGVKVGDKIIEWDGLPLSSLPIERIPQVIEQSDKKRIDLVIKIGRSDESASGDPDTATAGEGGRRRLPTLPPPRSSPRSSFSGPSGGGQVAQQPQHCGWIQLGVGLELPNLIVSLWSAEGLQMIESPEAMSLPKPYAIVRFTVYGSSRSFTTDVESSTQSPVWSSKHIFPNINPESLIDAKIDVTVWNFSHSAKQQCLGKTSIDLNIIELDSTLRWFPLNPPNDETGNQFESAHQKTTNLQHSEQQMKQKLRSSQDFTVDGYQLDNFQRYSSQHPYPSSNQIMSSTEEVLRSLAYQQHLVAVTRNYYSSYQHRFDNGSSQTSSQSSSPSLAALSYLSPKHNFLSPGPAQSRPCHSLPVSRRTSFACSSSYPSFHHLGPSVSYSNVLVSNTSRGGSAKLDISRKYSSNDTTLQCPDSNLAIRRPEISNKNPFESEHQVGGLSPFLDSSDRFKMRRKSDCYGDQRTAAAVAFGSNQAFANRSQGDYDRSRRNRSLDRSTEIEQFSSSHRGSKRGLAGHDGMHPGSTTHLNLQLGPLQLPPRGYRHTYQVADFPHYGELKLGFFVTDSNLEVEIVTARDLPTLTTGKPDTFVKTYLCEGDRRFLLRKTGVARFLPNAGDPLYRQTVKYLSTDISRRTLLAVVSTAPRPKMYEYDPMSGATLTLGVAEIDVDKLSQRQLVAGWYKLFDPAIYDLEHDSN